MSIIKSYLTLGLSLVLGCNSGNYTANDNVKDASELVNIYEDSNTKSSVEIFEKSDSSYTQIEEDKGIERDNNQTEVKDKGVLNYQKVCKNNIQWQWQDSCGTLEDKIQECALGEECKDGECVCQPKCYAKFCGNDSCGGSCGECLKGESCLEDTVCVVPCKSNKVGNKDWEIVGFNEDIQWKWGCETKKFLDVKKIGEDYLATVIGEGYFCGGQFLVKINAQGEVVGIQQFSEKIIDVFAKNEGYLVVNQATFVTKENNIVYPTALCILDGEKANLISCVEVDSKIVSKRKVNTVLQDKEKLLLAGTYDKGFGSSVYLVNNDSKVVWAKTYNSGLKEEINSLALHSQGYLLLGKKEEKEALKLVNNQGEIIWEKEYKFNFTDAKIVEMSSGMYGLFGKNISHYLVIDSKGTIVQDVELKIANPKTKQYLLQTPVELVDLVADGSFVAVSKQSNPIFSSWVTHFGANGNLKGFKLENGDEIQGIAVSSTGYMTVGTTWNGVKKMEWWMKNSWCEQ